MYRIRFHGRGGQGIKTASRILGTAFFLEGFEVQDAPRYGAERRGATMFAYVRGSRETIYERGVVPVPDLVVAVDASLPGMPAAGVFGGCTPQTVLLAEASHTFNDEELFSPFHGVLVTIDSHHIRDAGVPKAYGSSLWAGAAARLCGVISEESLQGAVQDELDHLGDEAVSRNIAMARTGWRLMRAHTGIVKESATHLPIPDTPPAWVDCPSDPASISAPSIRRSQTSRHVKTGLWRTERPVIDASKCGGCWWNCSVYCPDSAISLNEEGCPVIDYDYCKGCLVCARQCPRKAIAVRPEGVAAPTEKGGPP